MLPRRIKRNSPRKKKTTTKKNKQNPAFNIHNFYCRKKHNELLK